ncbi:MAG TPA: CNP1-like family protein [Burkholderiales bacterium]|nr:CNP1-like family protein [Burkholderiales bacterium]
MRASSSGILAILALALVSACSQPKERPWQVDLDEDEKSWKELKVEAPAYPKPENLVRVNTGAATAHEFYVDTSSITVSEDGVVRYVVVARAAGGATNVSFEGMRCETRERKLYALGRNDHSWAQARDTKWERVVLRDLTPHHHTLYHEYFCAQRTRPTAPWQAIDALKRGVGLRPQVGSDG